jgi:hypothetical protein
VKPAAKRLATPIVESTPSVTTAMSSDEDFMSDQMSEDDFDDDSLGELGRPTPLSHRVTDVWRM